MCFNIGFVYTNAKLVTRFLLYSNVSLVYYVEIKSEHFQTVENRFH